MNKNIIFTVLVALTLTLNQAFALGFNPMELSMAGMVLATTAYPSNPEMTAICQAYKNEPYVADEVCPFSSPVNNVNFKYDVFPIGEQLTVQDDRVTRKGEIPEIDYSSYEETASIEDHALSSYVPYNDVKSANDPERVKNNAAMQTMNKIIMNREIRVANLIFNADSYIASNVLAIASADDKFTNPNVNAMKIINERLDKMLMRANVMTLSQQAWLALRTNPYIVKAVKSGTNGEGMATQAAVSELFELRKIIVARANRNVNNNPKSLNAGKIWGPHLSLTYQESAIQTQGTFTFCTTVPFENADGITAGSVFDRKRGVRGSYEVRVAQQIKELIIAKEAGALITNVA